MIATLSFNLPEESDEHRYALEGVKWAIVVEEMDNYLRARLKHEELPDDVFKALELARDYLHEAASSRELSIF